MMVLASIVLLAASAGRELTEEVHQIPAGDWKYVEIQLRQKAARISASYEVLSPSGKVRAVLMLRDDLDRSEGDFSSGIAATAEGRHGDYAVVLDNQNGKEAVTVQLKVELDFGSGYEAKQLTPRRQLTIVAISFAVFFGIAGFSARRLLQAMRD